MRREWSPWSIKTASGCLTLSKYARVSESLRLQEGSAHGTGECLSGLVEVRLRFVAARTISGGPKCFRV